MEVTVTVFSGGVLRIKKMYSFETDDPAPAAGQMNWKLLSDSEVAVQIATGLGNIEIGAKTQGTTEALCGLQELRRRGLATPTMTYDAVLMNDKGVALFKRKTARPALTVITGGPDQGH